MKKLNRVLSVLLALSLCASLFSIAALAEGGEEAANPAETVQEELLTPAPSDTEAADALIPEAGQDEQPAPTTTQDAEAVDVENDAADVAADVFAATLVAKLKNHVLTNMNAGPKGNPGVYDKRYDPYIARLEAVIGDCADAYAEQEGQAVLNEQYAALNSYNKTNSTHDKAIIALLSEVLEAGVGYTHVASDGMGLSGRFISNGDDAFYTYCSEHNFAYPVKDLGYLSGAPADDVRAVAVQITRALEAGYPLDSYGLSKHYNDMFAPGVGMGMATQQVIWDILANKNAPTDHRNDYSVALFNYATTDQVLERVDAVTVTAQPESAVTLTYDEATGKYTGSFTLSAEKYAEITATQLPENAEVRYALPIFQDGTTYPLTGDTSLVPGSVITVVADGETQSVSGLSFSYVSYKKVGEELTTFLNYDAGYDGGHELGVVYQSMIGFGMVEVPGGLDVAVTLTGKPGQEPEEPGQPETAAGSLTLEKVFAGAEVAAPAGLTFTVESDNERFETRTLTVADFTLADGVYTCALEELPLPGTYTFTEQNAAAAGYDLAVTYAVNAEGADKAAAGLTEETDSAALRITNTYTRVGGTDEEQPPYVPPVRPPVAPTEPEDPKDPTPPPSVTPVEPPETEVEIPEEDTPLAGLPEPEQPPEPTLPDVPTDEIIIVDDSTPLGGLPQTGTVDAGAVALRDGLMMFFVLLSALSLSGLVVCVATRKRWK